MISQKKKETKMITNKNLIATLSIAFAILLVAGCNRQVNLDFYDFDLNENNQIEESEFVEVFTDNFYQDWNKTDDPYLDDEAFHQVVFDVWDVDDDEFMTRDEWVRGYDYYYGNYVVVDYEDIDLNKDNYIVYQEYYDVVGDTDFFVEWDLNRDLNISEEELAQGVFNRWDVNNDGIIDLDEFVEFDSFYLDI